MPRGVYVRTEKYRANLSTALMGRTLSAETRAKLSAAMIGKNLGNKNCLRHGQSRPPTPTYRSWQRMVGRCTNPKNQKWNHYGGRGITVCDRWHVFANFLADMGARPPGLTLDRKDNDGHYEPDNCRWATWGEQRRNQRRQRPGG